MTSPRIFVALILIVGLVAPAWADGLWVRRDGQRASVNAALLLEFEHARRDCFHGAAQISEGVVRCMRLRGYRWARGSVALSARYRWGRRGV